METEERSLLRSEFIAVGGSISLPVRSLPSSAFEVVPGATINALLAVVPLSALENLRLRSGACASVGGRVATVIAAEKLGLSCNNVIFLSPALAAVAVAGAGEKDAGRGVVTVERLPYGVQAASQVVLSPAKTSVTQSVSRASSVASDAKSTLLSRSVVVGDVVATSLQTWLVVSSVSASSVSKRGPLVVGESTDVALSVGATSSVLIVTGQCREWARGYWKSCLPRWEWDVHVNALECCIDQPSNRRGSLFVGLIGLLRDVRDVVECCSVGRNLFEIDGRDANYKAFVEVVARAELASEKQSVVLYLHHAENLGGSLITCLEQEVRAEGPGNFLFNNPPMSSEKVGLAIIVGCEDIEELSPQLRALILHEVYVPHADESERSVILASASSKELVRSTAGFSRCELLGLQRCFCEFGGASAVADAINLFGKGKLSVSSGNIGWADVGGLEDLKADIMQYVQVSKEAEDKKWSGPRRVGIMLHGPPGTGKTLIAKAVAGECGCSFISVKGPELLDMYVGESERNVREVFSKAEKASPCVIFFDEIDALAPARGRGGSDGGGVADRVVSQLLAGIDGVSANTGIFIIAATNRPDLVDPSILRPGRFDKLVFVPTPQSRDAQAAVLAALTRKFVMSSDVDLLEILSCTPEPPSLSGADLYGLAVNAWLSAVKRVVSTFEGESSVEARGAQVAPVKRPASADLLDRALHQENEAYETLEQHLSRPCLTTQAEGQAGERAAPDGADQDLKSQVVVTKADFLVSASKLLPSLRPEELSSYSQIG